MNEEELGKQMLKFELDQVKLGLRSRDRGNQNRHKNWVHHSPYG